MEAGMIDVRKVTLHHLEMNLVSPFKNSRETVDRRESILVELEDSSGFTGWGEVVAFSSPGIRKKLSRHAIIC